MNALSLSIRSAYFLTLLTAIIGRALCLDAPNEKAQGALVILEAGWRQSTGGVKKGVEGIKEFRENPALQDELWNYLKELAEARKLGPPDVYQAQQKLLQLFHRLASLPCDETVRLIAPFLEAGGKGEWHGDLYESPLQDQALTILWSYQIKSFKFRGKAPGDEDVEPFLAACKIAEIPGGPSVIAIPQIKGGLMEWRQWWRENKASYGKVYELPSDLLENPYKP